MSDASTSPGPPGTTSEGSSGLQDKAQEAAGQAQQKAREATDQAQDTMAQAQDKAREAAGRAQESVRQQVDERTTQAGEQVSGAAEDLRSVGEELRKRGKDGPAKIADRAAEQTEKVGSYLKGAGPDQMLHDVEDFGRERPWAMLAGGLALGVVAARFLKASSRNRYQSRSAGGQLPTPRPGTPDRARPIPRQRVEPIASPPPTSAPATPAPTTPVSPAVGQ